MNLRLFLVFSTLATISHGYAVFFMGPFNGKSHFLYLQSFIRALLDRGHEVTFLTSQSLSHLNLTNYTEVLIDPPFDIHKLCPFGITNYIDEQMGLMTPLSIAAHWMLPYSDNMTFYQRMYNVMLTAYDWYNRRFTYLPAEEALAKKYFAHLEPLPSLDDLTRSVSLNFVNIHRALAPPRPAMPGTISIGGAHITQSKSLPNDLQTFLDESKHGVVYFSLGTVVQSSKLPKEKIQAFLDSFKNLKQRVLWKFEDESLTDIPKNVMIRKWMPQNDILAHPNVVLFISHGGLFGTSESLYHGVPLLLIPFFGDQTRNAYSITWAGFRDYLTLDQVTKDSLSAKINKLTSDDTYLARAKQTSTIFKDNLVSPMDEAIFWIEHVCKFKGAQHLKSHAVNMSWFTYLLLDVPLFNLVALAIIIYVIRAVYEKVFSKKSSNSDSEKKRK